MSNEKKCTYSYEEAAKELNMHPTTLSKLKLRNNIPVFAEKRNGRRVNVFDFKNLEKMRLAQKPVGRPMKKNKEV